MAFFINSAADCRNRKGKYGMRILRTVRGVFLAIKTFKTGKQHVNVMLLHIAGHLNVREKNQSVERLKVNKGKMYYNEPTCFHSW